MKKEETKEHRPGSEKSLAQAFFEGRMRSNIDVTDKIMSKMKSLTMENEFLRAEIHELKARNAELGKRVKMAYEDDLTGLPNRRFFNRRMKDTQKDDVSDIYSILFIDVDEFKQINDSYGHLTGDKILKWLADFLVQNTRSQDICCRLAGDEFIIILPDTNAAEAQMFIDRLKSRLDDANHFWETPVRLSFGSATFPDNGTTVEALFSHADAAMYRDKKQRLSMTVSAQPAVSESNQVQN